MIEQHCVHGKCLQSETALHTHDSICFKRCRRKWYFSSPFSLHLQKKAEIGGASPNLWFGSGFHFALEDYFGYNKFQDPVKAFEAYVESFAPEELPNEVEDLVPLGVSMLEYFADWAKSHAKWKVVFLDGKPLVEVPFSLVLKELCYYQTSDGDRYFWVENEQRWQSANGGLYSSEQDLLNSGAKYQEVVFHGKLDAIVEDEHGRWWVLDYKTAKVIDTAKLSLDPQISKYCWAAEQWLQHEIDGLVYIQVSKNPPHPPKLTTKGVSTDQRQRTTHALYRQALIDYYGEVQKAPSTCIAMLNNLADVETENGNQFVRYDFVPRNDAHKLSTYQHIIDEGREMLSPNLSVYPNPTKDCSWDCSFKDMCLAMEEGADWKFYLEEFEVRNETMNAEVPKWELRMYHKYPELFPEEYKKYCVEGVDTLEDFLSDLEMEDE